ncbi:MAG: hypothetical protein Rubg2KO_32120 [Rubricoccaceae bacterium]
MRIACVLGLLLLAVPHSEAQVLPETWHPSGHVETQSLVLGLGGVVVGSAFGVVTARAASGLNEVVPVLLAAEAGYAIGVGLGVQLTGQITRIDGDGRRAMTGALVGGGIAIGITGGLALMGQGGNYDAAWAAILIGGGSAIVLPVIMSVRDYQAIPIILRPGPGEGLPVPGLSLRVGL